MAARSRSVRRWSPSMANGSGLENNSAKQVRECRRRGSNDVPLIPGVLLRVPGFIDEVMRYTLDTAPYPEPVLAFAGTLTLQAPLAGRTVRNAMDNRTNLYVLSLANSGIGKDHVRNKGQSNRLASRVT